MAPINPDCARKLIWAIRAEKELNCSPIHQSSYAPCTLAEHVSLSLSHLTYLMLVEPCGMGGAGTRGMFPLSPDVAESIRQVWSSVDKSGGLLSSGGATTTVGIPLDLSLGSPPFLFPLP